VTDTAHEDQGTFMISRWILLRMGNVSEKCCREHQNTYFTLLFFFRKSYLLWDMWKNAVQLAKTQVTI